MRRLTPALAPIPTPGAHPDRAAGLGL